LGINTTML